MPLTSKPRLGFEELFGRRLPIWAGGLARIASFAALGFSLIGIGWLYSRYLPDSGRADQPAINVQPLSAHPGE